MQKFTPNVQYVFDIMGCNYARKELSTMTGSYLEMKNTEYSKYFVSSENPVLYIYTFSPSKLFQKEGTVWWLGMLASQAPPRQLHRALGDQGALCWH